MANKSLFASYVGKLLPNGQREEPRGCPGLSALAEASAGADRGDGHTVAHVLRDGAWAARRCDGVGRPGRARFVAQAAICARKRGHMKDMPALLLAALSLQDPLLLARVFPRVIDNGRMLRNFVQIMRSGAVGRKSLGSRPKALVQAWLNAATDAEILRAAVGQRRRWPM